LLRLLDPRRNGRQPVVIAKRAAVTTATDRTRALLNSHGT